jgi:hypothetical protein
MSKKTLSRLSLAALVAAGVAGGAALASAQDMAGTFSKYYQAIRATELCRDTAIDSAQWHKIATFIDTKVNHEIGAGERLTLIETAKTDARKLVDAKGCEHQAVQDLLKVYDDELANL